MKPFFILTTPRARGSLLERALNNTPGVSCAGEASDLMAQMRAMGAWRTSEPEDLSRWKRGIPGGTDAAWHAACRSMLASWTGEAEFAGIRDSFLGRQNWRTAADSWGWLQTVWPEAVLIFLTRSDEDTEKSMEFTHQLWLPAYPHGGTCMGSAMRTVKRHRQSMRDYHEMNPSSTIMLDAAELLDFAMLQEKLALVGLPLDHDGWTAAVRDVVGEAKVQARKLSSMSLPAATTTAVPIDAPVFAEAEGIDYYHEEIPLTNKPPQAATPSRWPRRFRLPIPPPPEMQLPTNVYTLRYGEADWIKACQPGLDEWCARHGYELRVWAEGNAKYPDEKFTTVDMIRDFLGTTAERMIFIDADVFVHPSAPAMPLPAGFHAAHDEPMNLQHWQRWLRQHTKGIDARSWVYRNSGVWHCDRESAAAFLEETGKGRWNVGVREQHQFNAWWIKAESAGMTMGLLPGEWNLLAKYKLRAAWFFHLAGKKKMQFLRAARNERLLPSEPAPLELLDVAAVPRAILYPWKSTAAKWEELRFSLISVERHFADKECPIVILGDTKPLWLDEFPRAQYVHCPSYVDALTAGVQLAEESLWMNDDIMFLADCGWEDFAEALHHGSILGRARAYLDESNTWRQGVGGAMIDLHHYGADRVLNFSTHTPYRFEKDKAIATLRRFGAWYKVPFEVLYHTMHGTPCRDCDGFKTKTLPPPPEAKVLNFTDGGLTDDLKAEIEKRFGGGVLSPA